MVAVFAQKLACAIAITAASCSAQAGTPAPFAQHYSPAENLEQIDVDTLRAGRERIEMASSH